ncbi:MAG: sigma 54-interacting transcriptional regulator [Desulfobacterales bacterium]|nr:sigma 54-interacting transcriptional regulator [Desulfobacterales bacterium]
MISDNNQTTEEILNCITEGVFTVDLNWIVTSFNKAAEKITGIDKMEAIGRPCCEVFRANICETDCALKNTLETGTPIINKSVYIMTSKGKRVPISISTALFKNEKGQIIGGVETFRDLTVVEKLRKALRKQNVFSDIISQNYEMHQLFSILPQIAESESNLLIYGESGTGKELIARAIHNMSARKNAPLITINCGAIPDTLLESELFGYIAGAFTDARKDKPGRFALAEGGSIFLDEIGDISTALQVKLLRVLQEKEFEPLGGTNPQKANVRVITATNKDMETMVKEKKFREDLYYRINVIKIELPPLRARKEDIPILVESFIDRFNHAKGKDIVDVSEDAMVLLINYDWPGNIRELQNAIEHAFVLCRSALIEPFHLPKSIATSKINNGLLKIRTLAEIEKQVILDALSRNSFKKLATAQELGINKTTLWRKIKKFSINIPV